MSRSPLSGAALVALSLAIAAPAVPRAADPPAAADGLLAEAEHAVDAGRPEDAVAIYRDLAAKRPDDPEIQALLGRALSLADRYGEAVDALERAVGGGVRDLRTLLFLGSALWESGRPAEADAVLEEAVAASRGTAAELLAHHELGRLRLWAGRAREAIPLLERATVLRPGAATPRLDLARALAMADRPEEAVSAFRKAVDLAPDSHHARWGLAQALLRLGRREEAAVELAAYRELYAADQERTRRVMLQRAEIDRGWHRIRSGRPAEAEAVFRALIADHGEAVDPLLGLARALAAQGDHAGAADVLERAVTLAPDRDDLRRLLDYERLRAREAVGEPGE